MRISEFSWQLGAFAYETDFVDASQLVRALETWASDPEQDLVQILIEQGSLSTTDTQLLQALWDDRQSHTQRSSIPQGGDPTLGEDPASSFQPHCERGSPHGRVSPEESAERYEKTCLVGTGGLGRVWMARDQQLGRTVAIKELDSRLAHDPASLSRFVREASITGSLEHSAIVPVFSMGRQPDGTPFYAMRLMDGENLRTLASRFHEMSGSVVDCNSVAFRRLLGCFVTACQAIGFAHSRGVIHRDIKPANIVIGKYGETMVVDWGLARRLDNVAGTGNNETVDGSSPVVDEDQADFHEDITVEGAAIGTPSFMSPEQAQGNNRDVGRASDIFSLGATLYFLLTGRAPYQGKTASVILPLAASGQFVAPRLVRGNLPPPLEAICLKAMSTDASARYDTAESLAADIEFWLGDYPVSCYPEPWNRRVARLMRKHRSVVQVAIAALLLLAVFTSVFSVMLREQVKIARRQRAIAEETAEEKSIIAKRESAARQTATIQTRLALTTIQSVVSEVKNRLQSTKDLESARKSLLKVSLEGLDKVARSVETNHETDRETMRVFNLLGMTFLIAGDTADGDHVASALSYFQQALDIAADLAMDNADDPTTIRDLSIAWEYVGDAQIELGNLDLADRAFEQALQASQRILQACPNSDEALRDVAFGWEKIGDVRTRREQPELAAQAVMESVMLFQRLERGNPDNRQFARDAIVATQKLGNMFMLQGEYQQAADTFHQCLERIKQEQERASSFIQPRDSTVVGNKLGKALLEMGQSERAEAVFRDSLAVARQILALDPAHAMAQRDVGIALGHHADALIALGELVSARQVLEESLDIRRSLATRDSASFTLQSDLAMILARLGDIEATFGNSAASHNWYNEAHSVLETLGPEVVEQNVETSRLLDRIKSALNGR